MDIALVTGGTRGIGAAIARALKADGFGGVSGNIGGLYSVEWRHHLRLGSERKSR